MVRVPYTEQPLNKWTALRGNNVFPLRQSLPLPGGLSRVPDESAGVKTPALDSPPG